MVDGGKDDELMLAIWTRDMSFRNRKTLCRVPVQSDGT